ncbi:MAG TPA: hypothetical protein VGU20_31110 [Stellaceae bacterium]|nr:hypothetical protein [Terriglobia bacterium]HEV2551801.1 hypothetical protein [Stellaceae bacterium]
MSSYTKWISIELAERLHCLQQGSLNVGNTQQNRLHLRTLAIAQANTPSSPPWARWSTAANMKTGSAMPIQALQVYPARVPGFVKPVAS